MHLVLAWHMLQLALDTLMPPSSMTVHPFFAGEKVIIRAKYKPDKTMPGWRAMFAMAGNESFTTREQANAGNRLTRRTVAFHFGYKVDQHNRSLLDQMKAEMPKIVWVCSWALKALLAELGETRGMAGIVSSIPYLRDCVDDLNSSSRLMRKWLEETSQIVYGAGLMVEVDFLRDRFVEWKQHRGIRHSQGSGAFATASISPHLYTTHIMAAAVDIQPMTQTKFGTNLFIRDHAHKLRQVFLNHGPRQSYTCELLLLTVISSKILSRLIWVDIRKGVRQWALWALNQQTESIDTPSILPTRAELKQLLQEVMSTHIGPVSDVNAPILKMVNIDGTQTSHEVPIPPPTSQWVMSI